MARPLLASAPVVFAVFAVGIGVYAAVLALWPLLLVWWPWLLAGPGPPFELAPVEAAIKSTYPFGCIRTTASSD